MTPGVDSSRKRLLSRPQRGADLAAVERLPRRRAEVAAEELVGAVDQVDLHASPSRRQMVRVVPRARFAYFTISVRTPGLACTLPARSVAYTFQRYLPFGRPHLNEYLRPAFVFFALSVIDFFSVVPL